MTVKVLSSSTRLTDRTSKRLLYESAGVRDYWIVDPQVPSLQVLLLEDGVYGEIASVRGAERYQASTPLAVTIRPADLVKIARA